jgi:hypothetical protein
MLNFDLIVIAICILIIGCTVPEKTQKTIFHKDNLTNTKMKYWSVKKTERGEYNWLFRSDNTFSYYEQKKNGNIEILEWLAEDIRVDNKGVIPFYLKDDTLDISGLKYKIIKLTNDTLKVHYIHKKYNDTLLFVPLNR